MHAQRDNLLRQELGEVDADEEKAAAKAIPMMSLALIALIRSL